LKKKMLIGRIYGKLCIECFLSCALIMNQHNTCIQHCAAVILAGGQSKRMGQDKASVIFEGQTLLAIVEQSLTPLFEHVVVSTRQKRDDTLLPQVLDDSEHRAPMMGIVAAFEAVDTDWLFVVGVDMPFISADLLKHMAKHREVHDAVALHVGGMAQPLCCFYHRQTLPAMQQHIKQDKRSLKCLLETLNTYCIPEQEARLYDAELRSLVSLNTTADVKQWSKL